MRVARSSAWAKRLAPPVKRAKVEPKPDLFPAACVAAGLPVPVKEHRFHAVRKWRFDYAWPAQRIALEVEGGIWTRGRHTRGAGYLGDMHKYREAALAGWCVLRVTPDELDTVAINLVWRAVGAARRERA